MPSITYEEFQEFTEKFDNFCKENGLDFEEFFYKMKEVFEKQSELANHKAVKALLDANAEMCKTIAFNIYASYK